MGSTNKIDLNPVLDCLKPIFDSVSIKKEQKDIHQVPASRTVA